MSPSYFPKGPAAVWFVGDSANLTTDANLYWTTASTAATTYTIPIHRTLTVPIAESGKRLPPPLEFNRYINASDLMQEFIAWLGTQGVRKGEVLGLPMDLFIKWLIIQACEQDGEEPNVSLSLPAPKKNRCLGCGRFLPRLSPVAFHGQQCSTRYFTRLQAVPT